MTTSAADIVRNQVEQELLRLDKERADSGERQIWNKTNLSAMMARLETESNFIPTNRRKDDAGTGKDSVGLAQWNQGRLGSLMNFAKKQGIAWSDPVLQARFLDSEITTGTHKNIGDKFANAQNLTDAVNAAVMFESPRGSRTKINGEFVDTPERALGYKKTLSRAAEFSGQDVPVAPGGPLDVMKTFDSQTTSTKVADPDTRQLINDARSAALKHDPIQPGDTAVIGNMLSNLFPPPDKNTKPELKPGPGVSELSSLFRPRLEWAKL